MSITTQGPLLYAAENRLAADGKPVLILTVKAEPGWPVEARVPAGSALQCAAWAAGLPKGMQVTIESDGARPRSDHGLAVLVLLGVRSVVTADGFSVPGLLR